jgi:hypothetical protein
VPRFFVVAQIADSEGMEFVSILPGTRYILQFLLQN